MILYDIKKSLASLVKDFSYSILVTGTLSVTLAAALFLFSMVYTVQYRPLQVQDPETILWTTRTENGLTLKLGGLTNYEYSYIRDHQKSLLEFGRIEERRVNLSSSAFTEQIQGIATSSSLFRLLGVDPQLGRVLLATDDRIGAEISIVISDQLWNDLFNRNLNVIGSVVKIEGNVGTIVGVMPKGFQFPVKHDLWFSEAVPIDASEAFEGWNSFYGRVKVGESIAEVDRELKRLFTQIQDSYPSQFKGKDIETVEFTSRFSKDAALLISLMTVAGVAILVMGSFSACNLIIVRNVELVKEMLIKSALGIPFFRVVSGQLLEGFWICGLALFFGLWFTYFGILLVGENFLEGPYWWKLNFEVAIVFVGVIATVMIWIITSTVTVAFALQQPTNQLLASGRKGGGGANLRRAMGSLMTLQIFCAFVLIVFTGILVKALYKIANADYGVPRDGYLTAEVRLGGDKYADIKDRIDYYDRLVEQLSVTPGVVGVGVASALPGGWGFTSNYTSAEQNLKLDGGFPKCNEVPISETYLETMEISLLDGRNFSVADTQDSAPVAIVNSSMAEKLFPGVSAVGKQFLYDPENGGELITIVGVVENVVSGNPLWYLSEKSQAWRGQLYRPIRQKQPIWDNNLIILKSNINPYEYVDTLKLISRSIDTSVPLADIRSYSAFLDGKESGFRRMIFTFLPVSLIALVISAIGIFGLTRRFIIQGISDIGVMKSLGIPELYIYRKYLASASVQALSASILASTFTYIFLPGLPSSILTTSAEDVLLVACFAFFPVATVVLVSSSLPLISVYRMSANRALNYSSNELA